jgi:tartrate-resistant acid phosphatase type 5
MIRRSIVYFIVIIFIIVSCRQGRSLSGNKKNNGETHFFVLGDWGKRGKQDQQKVANQMMLLEQTVKPAAIITTGDNFYPSGVTSITDSNWFASYTNVYKRLVHDYNWLAVLGNHDYMDAADPEAQIAYHQVNARWNMDHQYYTRVFKISKNRTVRFVFVDTTPFELKSYRGEMPSVTKQDTLLQLKWMDSVLASSRETWKIVVGHHPVYSTGGHNYTDELFANFLPLLEKHHVQVYIAGHDHDLQHQRPAGSTIDYFVSGGGSESRSGRSDDNTKFYRSSSGFADFYFSNDSLHMKFIDAAGEVLYRYSRPVILH